MNIVRFPASRRLFLAFALVFLDVAVPVRPAGATAVFAGTCLTTGSIDFSLSVGLNLAVGATTAGHLMLNGTCVLSDTGQLMPSLRVDGWVVGTGTTCSGGVMGGNITVVVGDWSTEAQFTVVNTASAVQIVATQGTAFAMAGELAVLDACPKTVVGLAGTFVLEDPVIE